MVIFHSKLWVYQRVSIGHGNMWAISKTPRVHGMDIQKFGKAPSLTTRLHKNDIWQTWINLGGIACKNDIIYNDLLDSRAEAVLPFWSGIFAAGLWAIWGGATGRGALQISFPHRQHGQPACWPATSTQPFYSELSGSPGVQTQNAMALASFPGPYRPEPLPERISDRMPVYQYLSISITSIYIYIPIYLSIYLYIFLSTYLSICLSIYSNLI